MAREAELACEQAYLLYPQSPEAVWNYTMFLIGEHRAKDAQKFVDAARKLSPDDAALKNLAGYAQQMADYELRNQ